MPDLETKCWKCWGHGVLSAEDHSGNIECPECGGLGWLPTEDGRKLLDFVERHLGLGDAEEDAE